MATEFEKLPVELCLHIFSYLEPSSLLTLRSCSRSLLSTATSNSIWQSISLAEWSQHAAMMDVLALQPTSLAFSESPRGWFRAYIHIQRAVYSNWLESEDDIAGSMWLLWFRHHLTGVGVGDQQHHAVIEWTRDKAIRAISGLPLRTSTNWEIVSNGGTGVKVPAYPKYHPSRDRITWLRTLETHNVYMVADCPEFLRTIIELDYAIRTELSLPQSAELNQEIDTIIDLRNGEYLHRLSGYYRDELGNLDGSRSILLEHGHTTIGVNTTLSSNPDSQSEAGPSGSGWGYGDTSTYPYTLAVRPSQNHSPARESAPFVTSRSWHPKNP